jgi:hypothetical protein
VVLISAPSGVLAAHNAAGRGQAAAVEITDGFVSELKDQSSKFVR